MKPSEYKTVPVKPGSREDAVGEENLMQSAGIPPIILSSVKQQLNHPEETKMTCPVLTLATALSTLPYILPDKLC